MARSPAPTKAITAHRRRALWTEPLPFIQARYPRPGAPEPVPPSSTRVLPRFDDQRIRVTAEGVPVYDRARGLDPANRAWSQALAAELELPPSFVGDWLASSLREATDEDAVRQRTRRLMEIKAAQPGFREYVRTLASAPPDGSGD